MIGIIGVKRLLILLVLVIVNILFGAVIYMYLLPEQRVSDQELRSLRGKLSTVQRDLDQMHIEFEQLEKRQDRFDALKDSGFFSNQDRGEAKKLLSIVQKKSKVISATVSVKSGVIEDNKEAQKSNHKMLVSPVEVEIKAFDDSDVYRYIDLLQKKFPGHLSIDEIIIKRNRDITSALLRAIASGASPELVTAKIIMSWRTMIPQDQIILNTKIKR